MFERTNFGRRYFFGIIENTFLSDFAVTTAHILQETKEAKGKGLQFIRPRFTVEHYGKWWPLGRKFGRMLAVRAFFGSALLACFRNDSVPPENDCAIHLLLLSDQRFGNFRFAIWTLKTSTRLRLAAAHLS
jgi:hypothetical protein